MTLTSQQQDMIQFSNRKSSYPIATKFISQFSTWAKFWLSAKKDKKTKRKTIHPAHNKSLDAIPHSQRDLLYQVTCHKLRPNANKKTFSLGDVLHIRKFWEKIERLIYQHEMGYVPSTKRIPFNPDIPGSIYLPKRSRKHILPKTRREPFASTHIVYTFKQDINSIETQQLISDDDDDDDNVPLGILHFSKPFHPM